MFDTVERLVQVNWGEHSLMNCGEQTDRSEDLDWAGGRNGAQERYRDYSISHTASSQTKSTLLESKTESKVLSPGSVEFSKSLVR